MALPLAICVAILGAIGDSGQIGISELSQRLSLSKTTVHRVLQTLKALGYVTQEVETERYHLTIRLFELGAKALESVDLVREADIEMRRIAGATREAVHLGTFDEDAIIYIHKIDADFERKRLLGDYARGSCQQHDQHRRFHYAHVIMARSRPLYPT